MIHRSFPFQSLKLTTDIEWTHIGALYAYRRSTYADDTVFYERRKQETLVEKSQNNSYRVCFLRLSM